MLTTEQVNNVPNPSGRGGFSDHPENRNNGGRYPRGESLTYWMNKFKSMTVKEFSNWQESTPDTERTIVADLAYSRVQKATESLQDFKEVADRTEGKAVITIQSDDSVLFDNEVKIITFSNEDHQSDRDD
ncbi:hypothetical protein COX05_01570 [candidate division WWE3 bacterium CG22_combo_CG10-13_8_21_14_all_39_12]|uniref:DUF5681 domain-containing protein n=2 Tax=Katanobacteria TaxID=422282 RepID=A0A2M7X1I4_UNCKA|nr:MAG: hypothetical protein COX05_01570 [candidate division WWE3 bacterium CG22_combo_CG10-13_8_21_14_all_39_12]PJA40045.1 MAG: hypothetical protein CO179_03560 [candidate division WWE3 bacterium CG_4_9_14_3_um_filter_39_7]